MKICGKCKARKNLNDFPINRTKKTIGVQCVETVTRSCMMIVVSVVVR